MNGLYKVSNLGKIKRIFKTKEKLMTQHILHGYYYVCLCKDSKYRWYIAHRLVAQTFIPNPDNLPEINHKDEDKLNNKVSNLEWCTAKYNSNYGTRNIRKSKPIQCVETGVIYWGAREMERQTGIKHNNIAHAIKTGTKFGGYHWKYIEKEGGDNT